VTVAAVAAYALISAGALAALVRLVKGPSLADRVVATDFLLVMLACAVGVYTAQTGEGYFLELMVVVGVLGFLGTVTVARFIERRGA
jgi:multicomponent Na+:H+ antiporter subunit F